MSQELSNLIMQAGKDRELFMDLMIDVDAALVKQKASLSSDEVVALKKTFDKIRDDVTGEFAILTSASNNGRGGGFVGFA